MKTTHYTARIQIAVLTAILTLSLITTSALITPHKTLAATDTYPAPWAPPTAQDSMLDTWRELNRECTSYAAWMLHSVNGFEMPFFDNASNWGSRASALGYTVNSTPAIGSIYWTASPQHVAWVESISSNGTQVTLEDYNLANTGYWAEHTVNTSSASGYIHFKDTTHPASWIPITGDWDGNGTVTIGLYDPNTGTFYLRNSNTTGSADITFVYGNPGWIPITGDWDGNGTTTVGVYNPSTATYFLRNSNTTGSADITAQFGNGGAGWIPIAGDWDGNRTTTIGVYNSSAASYFLRNSNTTGSADATAQFGNGGAGWTPITGDWDGNGTTTIGVYNSSTAMFYLRNSNTTGSADITVQYGNPN